MSDALKRPSAEVLRQLLTYDPETGKLFWKERGPEWFRDEAKGRAWNTRYAGTEAFLALNRGYPCGTVLGKVHLAHRIIWAIHYGRWPQGELDHINCDPSDNRIVNLREATRAQNERNKRVQGNNTSEYKGVSWFPETRKWRASITAYGKWKHLGLFETAELAHEAYKSALAKVSGEYGRAS